MVTYSLNDIKASIANRSGLAKPSLFSVLITPPAGITNSSRDLEDMNILCASATLPTRKINTMDYSSFRQAYKVPNGYSLDDVQLTFILTGDFYLKNLMDSWTDKIVQSDSYRVNYQDKFTGTLDISQLNYSEESTNLVPSYTVRLIGAYPSSVSPIEIDSSAADTQKLTVTFSYYDYLNVPITL